MKKNVDSFIKNHHHINYCEVVIHKDGEIEYAIPSHVETLLRITNESRDIINIKMPLTASPIKWLVDYTGCISVWTDGFVTPEECTDEQMESLKKLIANNLTCVKFFG